jgi:hypothetical protein
MTEAPYFRAVACRIGESDGKVWLPADFADSLGATPDELVQLLPLP